jgi:hypothetical protein
VTPLRPGRRFLQPIGQLPELGHERESDQTRRTFQERWPLSRRGVRVFLGAILCDETRLAVVTVDLQCPLAVRRAGERQNVPRI